MLNNISEKQRYRILLTIKTRFQKYWIVWLSRLEASKFWLSERQMLNIINYLRTSWNLLLKWMTKCNNNKFKCNVYSLSNEFIELLKWISWYIKNTFKEIDIVQFIKSRFDYKKKNNKLIFNSDWIKYIVQLRWKFKNMIYDCYNNKIVSPFLFIKS